MCGSWGRASRRHPLRAIGYCVPRIQIPQPSKYLLMLRLPAIVAFALAGSLQPSTSNEARFLEAWRITRSAFYDPTMHGVDWPAVREELLPRAAAATTQAELSTVISDALSRRHASHTAHYNPDQREYYEILDVFWPDGVPPDIAIPRPIPYAAGADPQLAAAVSALTDTLQRP